MDSAELLERAHHYRMMAIRVTDALTKEGLLELAEHYEARVKWSRAGRNPMISEHLENRRGEGESRLSTTKGAQ
jgi:hypothetical protein